MKRLPFWQRPYFANRILDIGAGHNPFKGVTHVLEIDIDQGSQRGGNKLILPRRAKLIIGNAVELPFRSGSFDYVYASHVLEHVDRPELACKEIMRVGSAGYIETPSPFLEQGLALNANTHPGNWFHKWFIFPPYPGMLVFEPKTPGTIGEFCSCPDGQFMKEFYTSLDFRQAQHHFRRKAKTTIFYWKSSFLVEVRDRTVDCQREARVCRFAEMKKALLANCNDLFRALRLLRFRKNFPDCRAVFRKYRHRTIFVQ